MIKEKEAKLKEKLKHILMEIEYSKDIKQEVADEFRSRNMGALKAIWVFTGNFNIDTLTDSEEDIRFLFVFSIAMQKALENKTNIKINTRDYFTEAEYMNWINYQEEKPIKTIYPIVVEGVQKLADGIWQTIISAQQLNIWDTDNFLIYNFKTQRNPRITISGEKINIDKTKVQEIKERMLNGEQFPDAIKLNILHNGEDSVEYDERTQTLIVHSGVINIFDGYHRKTANSLALEKNPDLQFNWSVVFTNFSESKAKDYMMQINKQKPIKKEYGKSLDYSKAENLVVDAISDDRLSLLGKAMKDDDAYIRLNRALTKKSIIALAIAEQYTEELKLVSNIRGIARWIVEFTDYLMGTYASEFVSNPYEIKKTSMINHKNLFYGYIAMAKDLEHNDQWKQIVKNRMQAVDFSKENPLWRDLGIANNNNDANKVTRNKLYKLFTKGD